MLDLFRRPGFPSSGCLSWRLSLAGVSHDKINTLDERPCVNHTEFMDLHADCVALMRSYFVEAEKFTAMLADCTAKPLSLKSACS